MVDIRKVEGVDPSGKASEWVLGATPQGHKFCRVRFTVRIYTKGQWETFSPDAPNITDEQKEKVRNIMRNFVQSNTFSEVMGKPSSFYNFSITRRQNGKFVVTTQAPRVEELKVKESHQYYPDLKKFKMLDPKRLRKANPLANLFGRRA